MGEAVAVVAPADDRGAARMLVGLAAGIGSGVAAALLGSGVGRSVAWLMTFAGYGYASFPSVALCVALALAMVGGAVALASLDRLPMTIGAGAIIGIPLGVIFGGVSWTGFVWVLALGALAGLLGFLLGLTQIPALTRREFNAYFYSPIAYAVATVFLGLFGFIFWLGLVMTPQAEATLAPSLFFMCHFVLPFIAPVMTMRLFAEEMRTGTMEVLMTAPVKDWEVVASKYLTALATFATMVSPTLVHVASLYLVSERGPEPAGLVGGYLGLFLTAALFMAIGTFASSLTRNQIVAAILGFAMSFGFVLLSFVKRLEWIRNIEWRRELFDHITYDTHFGRFIQGAIDTRSLIYFVSMVVFILFLTVRVIESRKWR